MKTHWIRRNLVYKAYMFSKAVFAAWRCGFPSKKLVCYGITGTDGKSTSCAMLYQTLKHGGYKVGIISTVHVDIGEGQQDNKTKLTSVSHSLFQNFLRKAVDNGLTHMVIEVSSHALYQSRVWPIQFAGVGITNLTREHLDFHWTMEHYCKTKFRLFRDYVQQGAIGVMPHNFTYESLVQPIIRVNQLVCFGNSTDADIRFDQLEERPELRFQLHYKGMKGLVDTSALGVFNCDNIMLAAVLAEHAGMSWDAIVEGLSGYTGLPGRQELVVTHSGVTAMIDFALTPDALATLYSAVKSMGYKRLIAVFGATGMRDQGKRPLMGQVATERCDYVIITEDENYTEDGRSIMKAIESGIDQAHCADRYELVQDRRVAIARGLEVAQPGDIVIVTGMANFTSRGMNEGSIPWNERAVIEEEMVKLGMEVVKG